jgi:hypothetical protein
VTNEKFIVYAFDTEFDFHLTGLNLVLDHARVEAGK